jgi:hypothetical protein
MAPTIASTMVDRPAAQVFAYATDPARFREWQQGVLDAHRAASRNSSTPARTSVRALPAMADRRPGPATALSGTVTAPPSAPP